MTVETMPGIQDRLTFDFVRNKQMTPILLITQMSSISAMKLQILLFIANIFIGNALNASCPQAYCDNDDINTEPVVNSSLLCPNLIPETLATFQYSYNGTNYTLIELRGPFDPLDAADLVIAVPHGGDLRDAVDDFIDDRITNGLYCPSGCKTSKDSYTKEISEVSFDNFYIETLLEQMHTRQ